MDMTSRSYSLPSKNTIFPVGDIKVNPELFHMPVSSVSIRGIEIPDGQVFHFILALLSPSDEQSVQCSITLNNSPSYTDLNHLMRGVLLVEYHRDDAADYLDGNTAPSFVTPLVPGTTAATICNYLLNEHVFERYDFNENGQGCRHWCAVALHKLAEAGFVEADVGRRFEQFEKEQHAVWGPKFPMPRIRGSFYE